jgi:hypothetical protein
MNHPYQARYVAFAKANGRTPEEQDAHDDLTSPGACMLPFITWINRNVIAFREAHPAAFCGANIADHDAFTAFLETTPAK